MPRVLHVDCFSGASGDMLLGALLDVGVPFEVVCQAVDSLQLPGTLKVEKVKRHGFAATHITVETPEEHKHRHLKHIVEILDRGALTESARDLAKRMFQKLAEAEAACHGTTIEKVHFHEVGAVDSIFDFTGIAVALDWLRLDGITSSPVPTGTGWVDCEHGRMPVPAPATARLLVGLPLAASTIPFELTTPTGAAVLATVVNEFTLSPLMTIESVGLGAGTRDMKEQPNLLRVMLGTSAADKDQSSIWSIATNLDDAPGERIGYAVERLFAAGALDVFTTPVQMKKNRPGVLLTILAEEKSRERIERTLLLETGSFGLRRHRLERTTLTRHHETVMTPWGEVRVKVGVLRDIRVVSPEHEDCARLAAQFNVPMRDVFDAAQSAARSR